MGDGVGGAVGGGNFGLGAPERELSQQTEPLEQVVGVVNKTEGRSQKAAMSMSRQKPGQRCTAGGAGGGGGGAGEFSVLSAKDMNWESKSPPDCVAVVAGGGGGAGFAAGLAAGLLAILVAGLLGDAGLAGVDSEAVLVIQQLPSPGQKASESISSQKMAKMPFMHSPSHSFSTWP